MSAHLGEGDAERLVQGAVSDAERQAFNAHTLSCAACHRRVIAAAQALLSHGTSVFDAPDDAPSAPAPALDGSTLFGGRYIVLEHIGRGGMGSVYLAHDTVLRREVALKILLHRGHRFTEVALAEARAIAAIRHPNVVTVFDLALADGALAIAMELVRGSTLRHWLLTPPRRAPLLDALFGVTRGLAAAHAAGIVHGDVKPDNVLIDADGQARLADFGLSRLADATSALAGGTLAYMAPELAAGGPATPASDQYALAATWVESLDGRPPHTPSPDWRTAAQRVRPRWARRPLTRALAPHPDDRHPDLGAFMRALLAARRRRFALVAALVALALLAPWGALHVAERAAVDRCIDQSIGTLPALPPPELFVAHPAARHPTATLLAWSGAAAAHIDWLGARTLAQIRACEAPPLSGQRRALVDRCHALELLGRRRVYDDLRDAASDPTQLRSMILFARVEALADDIDCDDPHLLQSLDWLGLDTSLDAIADLFEPEEDSPRERVDALIASLESHGPSALLSRAYAHLAHVHLRASDRDGAMAHARRAVQIAQQLRDSALEGGAWMLLAEIAIEREARIQDARFYVDNARTAFGPSPSRPSRQWLGETDAVIAFAAGDPDELLRVVDPLLRDPFSVVLPESRLMILVGLARFQRGDLAEARAIFEAAYDGRRRDPGRWKPSRVAGALHDVALADMALGRHDDAMDAALVAHEMRAAALGPDDVETLRIELTLARLGFEGADSPAERELHAARAEAIVAAMDETLVGDHHEVLHNALTLAELDLARDLIARAEGRVRRVLVRARANGYGGFMLARAHLVLAEIAVRRGLRAEAYTHLDQALAAGVGFPSHCVAARTLAAIIDPAAAPPACRPGPVAPSSHVGRLLQDAPELRATLR